MKKVLLISYGDYEYDGRLRGLAEIFNEVGDLNIFVRDSGNHNINGKTCNKSYFSFVIEACKFAKEMKNIDVLVLDNRKATIPGLIIKLFLRPKCVIQDCRELYIFSETHYFVGKIGCIFEKFSIRSANIVICANEERSRIMKEIYHLSRNPLVYENVRQLKYDSDDGYRAARKKLESFIIDGEYRIISSSGCSASRTNDILVKNLSKIDSPCRLFLVGDTSDKNIIENIVKEQGLDNVEIFDQLNQNELKYLIQNSHIGIVNYHQNDTNNKYCASGKIYEFIYEGIPVVTTTNPPLVSLCEKNLIGFSDDLYFNAINKVINDYALMKNNVEAFIGAYPIENYNFKIIQEIKNMLGKDYD